MVNLKLLNNISVNLKDLKDDLIEKTRFFVDDNFPAYHQFLVSLKEKCKSQPIPTPEKSSAGKTVMEKLFGKKSSNVSSSVPPVCFDEKTFDFIASQIKDWNQKYYFKIELSRDSMVQEFSDKINEIEDKLNQIIKIVVNQKRFEDHKKSIKDISSSEDISPKVTDKTPELKKTSIASETPDIPASPDYYLESKTKEVFDKTLEILNRIERKDYLGCLLNHINKHKTKLQKTIFFHISDNTLEDFYKCLNENVDNFNKNNHESILNIISVNCLVLSPLTC